MKRALLTAVAFAMAATSAACSSDPTESAGDSQSIAVQMTDNSYSPTSFDVKRGETVTFEFINDGRMTHEAYIGNQQAQGDHAESMMDGDDHPMGMADDGEIVTVEPGGTKSMTHTFDEDGTVLIGCHQPGQWESGMKATVNVD